MKITFKIWLFQIYRYQNINFKKLILKTNITGSLKKEVKANYV